MKRLILTTLMLLSVMIVNAQETVNVAFTACTEEGLYCPFTTVSAINVTRGWTETLVYPDTVLTMTTTTIGVTEYANKTSHLGGAYPNPFKGETFALLELSEDDEVLLQVYRIDGIEVASKKVRLSAGTYRIKVRLSAMQPALLSVTIGQTRFVDKLFQTGEGMSNALDIDFVSSETKHTKKAGPMRLEASGEFALGDEMRYEAQLLDGGATIYSSDIIQSQYGDETVILHFSVSKPVVSTYEVTNVTQTGASCGGNVTYTGGLMVMTRGVCWSITDNPTVTDSHTSDGSGEGCFTSSITGLSAGKTYHVRAYAKNRIGTSYGNDVTFTTEQIQTYTITATADPANGGNVSGGGNFSYGQSCTLTASPATGYNFLNWTKNGTVVSNNANYTFTVTENASFVAHFETQAYTITATADPANGGSVSGAGNYTYGQSCTLTASPATGYNFLNWTKDGIVVSYDTNYTFTVTSTNTYIAHFQLQSFTITVVTNPTDGGSVAGGGSYNYGQNCTVVASAANGYEFVDWSENGVAVSSNESYTFTVSGDHTLVANFNVLPEAPTGAINGLFSVSKTQRVWFSKGNLQYVGSTQTWRFAANQWTVIGTSQGNSSQSITRDLFGWGTSGWNCGNTYYRPWDVARDDPYLYYNTHEISAGYGPLGMNDLTGTYAHSDWGIHNTISNTTGQWRTLSEEEWVYVLNTRTTSSGIRFALARVNNVKGVILFPDNWNENIYNINNPNPTGYNNTFNDNVINASQWNILENAGAVFLPCTGLRSGTDICNYGSHIGGFYWTSTASEYAMYDAYAMDFDQLEAGNVYALPGIVVCYREDGCAVRLVCPVD